MRRRWWLTTLTTATMLAMASWTAWATSGTEQTSATSPHAAQAQTQPRQPAQTRAALKPRAATPVQAGDSDVLPVGKSPTRGPRNAPVTIMMFTDFQCPFCKRVMPTIDALLTKPQYRGKLRLVFKHMPLSFHKDAPLAAQASMAAHAQGKFWQYQNKVWDDQRQLKREDLERHAQALGLNMKRFRAALDQGTHKAFVDADIALAGKVGVRGTPNFFINGHLLTGAQPQAKFEELIDAEIKATARMRGLIYPARVKENYKSPSAREAARPPRPGRPDQTQVYKVPVDGSPIVGDKDALVTIVTFSEFECPFCGRVQPTLRQVLLNNPGKVRVVFKHNPLPFHKNAKSAARAAIAAGEQGKFWQYHDLLFQNQKQLDEDSLVRYARELDLNVNRFIYTMNKSEAATQRITDDQALAEKLGARGTPSFFINGRFLAGAQPLQRFQDLIDAATADAKPLIDRGLRGDALYEAITKDGLKEVAKAPAKPPSPPTPDKVYTIKDAPHSPIKGARNAPVTLVMFSNFQCPFCGRAQATMQEIEKTYGRKVRFVFKSNPLPFHKRARPAAIAAMAAHRQGKFWQYHDLLFQNQKALEDSDLEDYARQVGLNIARFRRDIADPQLEAMVQADQKLAEELTARGTPTFFVNGVKVAGAQPFEAFKAHIDKALNP